MLEPDLDGVSECEAFSKLNQHEVALAEIELDYKNRVATHEAKLVEDQRQLKAVREIIAGADVE